MFFLDETIFVSFKEFFFFCIPFCLKKTIIMKKYYAYLFLIFSISISSCLQTNSKQLENEAKHDFKYFSETFSALKLIRYKIPGFEKLSLNQKKLVKLNSQGFPETLSTLRPVPFTT